MNPDVKNLASGVHFSSRFSLLERWLASPLFWAVFLVLGLAIRFRQYLFAHSYWYDEAFMLLAIREHGFADLLGPQPYHVVSPPGFLWVTRALYEIGATGECLMRLPAFVAGIAALLLMIPLARKLIGNVHAVWALVFFAVSRATVLHSCEVHPYTFDMLVAEVLLYATVTLTDPATSRHCRRWASVMLCLAGGIGVWLSFPAVFVMGGVSLALAVNFWKKASWRASSVWCAFNGLVGLSGLMLWWFSARHLYYEGMIEHWGHRGWGGFPDWGSASASLRWLLGRPFVIGHYGTRELGFLLAPLAVVGGWTLAKRSPGLAVLLVAPFALATAAALLGKYPLVDRTTMFLLPCLWLLVAAGIGSLVAWGRRRGWELAFVGLVPVAFDLVWLGARLGQPESMVDYRGAYEFVHAQRQPGDRLLTQSGVVYLSYYGKEAPVWIDHQLEEATREMTERRIWVVMSDSRPDIRQGLEAVGGHVVLKEHFSKVDVFLFEPRDRTTVEDANRAQGNENASEGH
jgi:4-amino-4-deoxy-L-arabinose transferase-like glycosyltransferase